MTTSEIDRLARLVWDFHLMHHALQQADCIVALGSHDTRTAERAAEIYLAGWAPLLIMSGKAGAGTANAWTKPEAEVFAEIAIAKGVPPENILLEKESTNSGENMALTKALLDKNNLTPKRVILVQKPYMERRAFGTAQKQWPGPEFMVTSPNLDYDQYIEGAPYGKEDVIARMVSDLLKMPDYAAKGFMTEQEIPKEAWEAAETLATLGYRVS